MKEKTETRKLVESLREEKEKKEKEKMKGLFFDEETKSWAFRLAVKDGLKKKFDTVRTGYKNQSEARAAKEALRIEVKGRTPESEKQKIINENATFADVFAHYKEHRAPSKSIGTEAKRDLDWKNHIEPIFGNRRLADVSKGEIYNFILRFYNEGDQFNKFAKGYSYNTTEHFFKFFWLIYGYAHDVGMLDPERYKRDFVDKSTRLKMPSEIMKLEVSKDEDEDIETYSVEEIEKLREAFRGRSLYPAFLICYSCGLRISECFGLLWSDIIEVEGGHKFQIRRQLLRDNKTHSFYIGPLKTISSKRDVWIPDNLYSYLMEYKTEQDQRKKSPDYNNKEIVSDKLNKDNPHDLIGGNFILRMNNGKLITSSTTSTQIKTIKRKTGIDFHFHILRHTNASLLAAQNIPLKALADHMGHKDTSMAEKYYIGTTAETERKVHATLNALNPIL